MKEKQSTLDRIRTRPRFRMIASLSADDYTKLIKTFLEENRDQFTGTIHREGATISVKNNSDAFYKPYLTLRASEEDGHTIIRGIFGPSPAVWTFFMFQYFILAILLMVFLTLYFVGFQIGSDEYHWGLPASFFVLFLFLVLYLAARYGQKKGKDEMEKLRQFAIESTLACEKI